MPILPDDYRALFGGRDTVYIAQWFAASDERPETVGVSDDLALVDAAARGKMAEHPPSWGGKNGAPRHVSGDFCVIEEWRLDAGAGVLVRSISIDRTDGEGGLSPLPNDLAFLNEGTASQ